MNHHLPMRHIFLMRHAKSAWPEGVRDFDRPLAPRGQAAAPLIGAHLATHYPLPDRVLVSTARRTRETFAALGAPLNTLEAEFEPQIYDADPHTLLTLLQELERDVMNVLMVGHNPGTHALALDLADPARSSAEDYARLDMKFPTAGVACLRFSGAWRSLSTGTAQLFAFITPKHFGGVDED
jgi:phosphohistidine phosphatase